MTERPKPTLKSALDEFLIEQQIRGNSLATVKYYCVCIGLFAVHTGEDKLMEEIILNDLQRYYMALQGRKLSTVTVQSYIRAVRAFLTWCYNEGYMSVCLPDKFKLPKAKRNAVDVLTDGEVRRLMASFVGNGFIARRNACICALMLDSGLRMNEVVSLTIGRVHIAEGYIIVDGKGNKQRIVPIGLYMRKALMRYLAVRPGCIDRAPQETPLFVKDAFTPISRTTVKQLFRKLKKRTNIPRLKAHLLRHTFATRYLENGGDIYSLQQILGHTSLEMVRRYVHTIPRKTVVNFSRFSPLDNLPR